MTSLEDLYTRQTDEKKIKKLGQVFTPQEVAVFMAGWLTSDRASKQLRVLDPAVGNCVFGHAIKSVCPSAFITGYEVDPEIIDFFSSRTSVYDQLIIDDFFNLDWDNKFDCIICNPPYNRFQSVDNRAEILRSINDHSAIKLNGQTNQYAMFLMKCMHLLSDAGRLCFLIPFEFMNSKFGEPLKKMMIEDNLLSKVVFFDDEYSLFEGRLTTSCLIMIDKEKKDFAEFVRVTSENELSSQEFDFEQKVVIPYKSLSASDKWQSRIAFASNTPSSAPCTIGDFCTVRRGIATGANSYFLLSKEDVSKYEIAEENIIPCVVKSADIKANVLTQPDLNTMIESSKPSYLFSPINLNCPGTRSYLEKGVEEQVDKKYLPAHRREWYRAENVTPAPILISTACRGSLKVVRNIAMATNLTTFHCVYPLEAYEDLVDVIFCYLLSNVGQDLIRGNKKVLASGLDKYQPNDIKSSPCLDLRRVSSEHSIRLAQIVSYAAAKKRPINIKELDEIFSEYL